MPRLALESYKQFEQGFGMIEWIASREGNTIEQCIVVDFIDNARQYLLRKGLSGLRRPTFGIVASGTGMAATCQVNGIAQPVAVGYGFGIYVYNVEPLN